LKRSRSCSPSLSGRLMYIIVTSSYSDRFDKAGLVDNFSLDVEAAEDFGHVVHSGIVVEVFQATAAVELKIAASIQVDGQDNVVLLPVFTLVLGFTDVFVSHLLFS
jgi:hypothetical protein